MFLRLPVKNKIFGDLQNIIQEAKPKYCKQYTKFHGFAFLRSLKMGFDKERFPVILTTYIFYLLPIKSKSIFVLNKAKTCHLSMTSEAFPIAAVYKIMNDHKESIL